jgi:hypothetical protein
LGVRRVWQLLSDEVSVNLRTDRFKFSSPGLFGAKSARPSGAAASPDTAEERPLTSKVAGLRLKRGDHGVALNADLTIDQAETARLRRESTGGGAAA